MANYGLPNVPFACGYAVLPTVNLDGVKHSNDVYEAEPVRPKVVERRVRSKSKYCVGYPLLSQRYIDCGAFYSIVEDKGGAEADVYDDYFMEDPHESFIVQCRVEDLIDYVCHKQNVCKPNYIRLPDATCDGIRYYRYEVTVSTPLLGGHHVFKGRYARSVFFAREDAAREVLDLLSPAVGMDVWDYHYTKKKWRSNSGVWVMSYRI
ncbi:hypothetical protein SESBI_12684 [Sesbania bispinosa]|nr:hypothetical protein SESBI_12684 [Sesbania bispinosa]